MRSPGVCFLFAFIYAIYSANGAAMHEDLDTEIVYGRSVKYCEHKGLRLLRRSKFKDYDDCSRCTCNKNGLSCYTMFPLMLIPEESECTYQIVGCKVIWVMRENNEIRCPKDKIPDISK